MAIKKKRVKHQFVQDELDGGRCHLTNRPAICGRVISCLCCEA